MDRERFAQILDAYGADAKRWPDAERAAAQAFIAAHPADASALLGEARALDGVLDATREASAPNPALASRIMNGAPRKAARASAFGRGADWALAACALLSVAIGYGGGMLAPRASAQDPDSVIVAALEMTFAEPGWSGDGG
jgi:hypothetical protein